MLSKVLSRQSKIVAQSVRFISSKAQHKANTEDVTLRGTFLQGRRADLPTMIWFSDLVEPASNFQKFFANEHNKILDVRNVWLLDIRNMGDSDHHESFDMHEISADVARFMDQQKLTMATLGGHGFGAKVALATAINNMERCTGVINLEGGPLDHRFYESYQELEQYVKSLASLDPPKTDVATALKFIQDNIHCQKWASIFKQNIEEKNGMLNWKFNLEALHSNMKLRQPDVACWHQHYGLWPGQALALFAAHSRWVHLATNTLQFYNVIPRLQGQFPGNINIHADGFESPLNHWLHEGPDQESVWRLS